MYCLIITEDIDISTIGDGGGAKMEGREYRNKLRLKKILFTGMILDCNIEIVMENHSNYLGI